MNFVDDSFRWQGHKVRHAFLAFGVKSHLWIEGVRVCVYVSHTLAHKHMLSHTHTGLQALIPGAEVPGSPSFC